MVQLFKEETDAASQNSDYYVMGAADGGNGAEQKISADKSGGCFCGLLGLVYV